MARESTYAARTPATPELRESALSAGGSSQKDDFLHPNTAVVINEAAARAYFPYEEPIGKQIMGKADHQWKTVVGVVSDTKNTGLDAEPQPQVFVNSLVDPDGELPRCSSSYEALLTVNPWSRL